MNSSSASDFENESVHNVYTEIAREFSDTRHSVWPSVKRFLDQIPKNTRVLEVGCGNGKNLAYLDDSIEKIGCDMCEKFVDITRKKGITACNANALDLPFKDNDFDVVLSVAVIHHLSTEERRLAAVQELIRVTKPGGVLFIQVWALEQPPESKRKFTKQDTMVSWKNKHDRFYHVFKKGELEGLIDTNIVDIITSEYDYGNWYIICQKKEIEIM
jgi:ubiquinone/menaquinone biosynthesis C-methylase UbiE